MVEVGPDLQGARISAVPKNQSLAQGMKLWLTNLKKADHAVKELKNHWYYLEAAIEFALQQRPHPRALPFRVTAEFQRRRYASHSAVDLILEDELQRS